VTGPSNSPTRHDLAENKLRLLDSNPQTVLDSRGTGVFSSTDEGSRADVTARDAVAVGPTPTTSDEALKLAIKLAVDAGEYERAAALLDVVKRLAASPSVSPIVDIATRKR